MCPTEWRVGDSLGSRHLGALPCQHHRSLCSITKRASLLGQKWRVEADWRGIIIKYLFHARHTWRGGKEGGPHLRDRRGDSRPKDWKLEQFHRSRGALRARTSRTCVIIIYMLAAIRFYFVTAGIYTSPIGALLLIQISWNRQLILYVGRSPILILPSYVASCLTSYVSCHSCV